MIAIKAYAGERSLADPGRRLAIVTSPLIAMFVRSDASSSKLYRADRLRFKPSQTIRPLALENPGRLHTSTILIDYSSARNSSRCSYPFYRQEQAWKTGVRFLLSRKPRGSPLMKLIDQWKKQDSLDVYEVKHWGKGYFGINDQGHVTVHPDA